MIRTILCALALLVSATASGAQAWLTYDLCHPTPKLDLTAFDTIDPQSVVQDAEAISNGVGRLWQIEAPNGAVSHLWGTYHNNRPQYLRLPEQVTTLINSARVVALEYDPTLRSRSAVKTRMSGTDPFMPGWETDPFRTNGLERVLDPETAAAIDARLTDLGWGADTYQYLRHELLAEILLSDPCNDFAFEALPIQDAMIQALGVMAGAEILGLEAPSAFQDKLGDPKNRGLAFDTIRLYAQTLRPGHTLEQMQTWAAIAEQGRSGLGMALERALLRSQFGHERGNAMQQRVDDYLLSERNINFADAAETALQQGGLFMAIGSWHLPDTGGMVDLLRQRGYVTTRIPLIREAQVE